VGSTVLSLLVVAITLTATDADLAAAESAYAASRYDLVLPALDRAQARALSPNDERRAWELRAVTCAAFDRPSCAVESYRHVLGFDPDFAINSRVSPKLLSFLQEAKTFGALPTPEPPTSVSLKPNPSPATALLPPSGTAAENPTAAKPVYQRGWFWGVVSVIVVGAAAGTVTGVFLTRRSHPPANLGWGTLN
jgi:hypothetical protein